MTSHSRDPAVAAPAHPGGWLMATLLLQIIFGVVAMTLCLPSMPTWATEFNASQASVQLTFSAYVAAFGGLQLVYGPWSDRIGRKPLLLGGMALVLLGSVIAALAPNLAVLVLGRVLQGAGGAAGMSVGRAMVQDFFSGRERTRMMAYVGMAMGTCPPLATLLGGQVHVALGWQANFWITAGLAALALLAAWRGLPTRKPVHAITTHWLTALFSAYGRLLREPTFLSYVLIMAMLTSAFYCFLSGAPIVLTHYGVPPDRMGWYIMAVPIPYIFGNMLTSRLVHHMGDRRLMGLGFFAVQAGLWLMLLLAWGGLHTPWAFALPLTLLGLGHGLIAPPAISGSVGLIPALAGAAAAVAGASQQVMGAFGSYVVGLLDHEGPVNLGLLMMGFSLMGGVAQLLLSYAVRPKPVVV
ncbi:MAG: multidrug effflux MFS transporter [Hylemonella sp.]|nr:multidrug effflux MFS transporter [Hylemonella sp.]